MKFVAVQDAPKFFRFPSASQTAFYATVERRGGSYVVHAMGISVRLAPDQRIAVPEAE